MPHFIIECNKEVLQKLDSQLLVKQVFETALESGLFDKGNIKTRVKSFDDYLVAGENKDFIHVWGYIKSGRTNDQKQMLSSSIAQDLNKIAHNNAMISVNIAELDNVSYFKI